MTKTDILVSAIVVLRDNASILPSFVEELSGVLDSQYTNYEILLVDNASADSTNNTIHQLLAGSKCLRFLRLTRPVDDETALMAGLDAAIGDYVVTLHPDYDVPACLVPMVEICRAGNDLVLGVEKQPSRPGFFYRILRHMFLGLALRLVRLDFIQGTTGFRVISRQGVNALVKVRLRRRYFAVVAADVGLKTATYSYERTSRSGRHPSFDLLRAIRIGMSVLVHNSITPLRVASILGLLGSLLSFLYSLYVLAVYLFKTEVAPGWTTLSLAMSGLFGLCFLMLALMGEYLGRLLEESAQRPLYHVRDEKSSSLMLSNLARRNVLDQSEEPGTILRSEKTI